MDKKELLLKEKLKKDFPRLDAGGGGFGARPNLSAFWSKFFGVVKFILGICLLPFVYSFTSIFLNEFSKVEIAAQNYFWYGVASLLVIYLFIWEPALIYAKGQKILEALFTFFKPLVRVAPFLLPVYFIILTVVYGLVSLFNKSADALNFFVFLFGLSMALHLVFSAKTLRARQGDFLKANYIFGFSFLYLLNLALLAFFFSLIFVKFSFVHFCNASYQSAAAIFSAVFSQLFVNK